jgi:colanic acid/amylovoran biosynthesis protein
VTHILIINLHSSRNAGDATLTLAATQQLHEAFPGSTITLSMNDPLSHPGDEPKVGSFMHWFHTISANGESKWRLFEIFRLVLGSLVAVITYRQSKQPRFPLLSSEQRNFLQAYFDANLVASAPGNFLYSSGRFGLSFLAAIYSMAYALWSRKPLYLLPQSVGPLKHRWERWLVRQILNRARSIMIREEYSMRQITQAGVTNPQVFLQPDMAFSITGASKKDAEAWLISFAIELNAKTPFLGVTAINWGEQTGQHNLQAKYESALAAAVSYFIEHVHGKVIFFPQVTGIIASSDDRLPAQRVIASLPDIQNQLILIDTPPASEVLKAAYSLMDIFIGTRMHSNIFALSGYVPVLAIAYRHKTQGIMHMVGLDEWCLDIQAVNGTILTDRLAALWEQRDAVRIHIQQTLPSIIEASRRAGTMIAEDYQQLIRVPTGSVNG